MERKWTSTSCARTLSRMLSLRSWSVASAICIGIGSFSLDWEHRYRSLWQLVLFRAVLRLLSPESTSPLTPLVSYAQEPAFTPLDIEFLARLGITHVSAGVERHITSRSFVYAPFVDWFVLLPVFLRDRDPEVYVGNEVLGSYAAFANSEEKRGVMGECDKVGKVFLEGRERRRVPAFEEHGNAFEGLMVYWREEDEDEE